MHPEDTERGQGRFSGPREDFRRPLAALGAAHLEALAPLLSAADPEGRVAPRSRHLCAALGLLGRAAYGALGGGPHEDAVGIAGAALSLLTKVDDEVIDAAAFHGGMAADRAAVRARTESFLAPTLASLRAARAATAEPRCALAADVGRRLRALSARGDRLAHVLDVIAEGWSIQVDAVATLSSHPGEVSPADVASVTRRISGAWLLMIALVGTLPEGAARPLSADEEAAFYDWGFHIQRADALADLEKDGRDGLVSSFAGRLAWEREPAAYLAACAARDAPAVYAMVARHRIDVACLDGGAAPPALAARLAALGAIPALLEWIHGFLVHRYLAHPLCGRDGRDAAFHGIWARRALWADAAGGGHAPPRARAAAPAGGVG